MFKVKNRDYWFCEEIQKQIGNMCNQEIILSKEECKHIIDMNSGFTRSKLAGAKMDMIHQLFTYDSLTKTTDEIRPYFYQSYLNME